MTRSIYFLMLTIALSVCNVQSFWNIKTKHVVEPVVNDEEAAEEPKSAPTTDKTAQSATSNDSVEAIEYGVDVSFPMHYMDLSTNYAWLPHNLDPSLPTPKEYVGMSVNPLGDRTQFYNDFIQGCVEKYGSRGQRCISTESDRIAMSLRQPKSMVNYTDLGFKKIKAPPELFKLVKDFWDKNKNSASEEQWGIGNTYTNNWASPTKMVSVENTALRGGGYGLKQQIWNAAKNVISEWTGQELTQCSLYGIRIYYTGAVLATHVDRLPLVSSAIINVDQDLDEPWPLEVIGHDGIARNVTMEPGDMVLYESHSVLHGRPFPLKGRFLANIFVHFEPTGHSLRHHGVDLHDSANVDEKYKDATRRGISGHENDHDGLPSYIIPNSEEEPNWRRSHPQGQNKQKQRSFQTGSTSAHAAAQVGDVRLLEKAIMGKKDLVNARDENGWTPLHEGARSGHLEIVKLLVEHGADMNAKTNGYGGTALYWAKKTHSADHPVVQFLESMGALEAGPEL